MNLKLNTFNKKMTLDERKATSIVQSVRLEGLIVNDEELTKAFLEMMDYIYEHYVMDRECVFRLKNETCNCGNKLVRKGEYEKEITLPGGSSIFLKFYRYSCKHCKKPVDRKLSKIFEPNKQYSKNIKSDAIRLYSKHLSSYELVTEELNKLYKLNLDKKTVRLWLNEAGFDAEKITLADGDFSGHIVYDEEYIKVFLGDIGIKGAKLEWITVYLLLFRDAIKGKVIVRLVESLDGETLTKEWINVIQHLKKKGITVKSFGTDGKREYPEYIKNINKELNISIDHVYDMFHYEKNLYESSNEEIFGNKYSKKELPVHVLNQIKLIEQFFSKTSKEDAKKHLQKLKVEKNLFLKSLRHHIERLDTYFENYTKFFEIPEMKTTNLCEGWFARTKPKKLKREYKTIKGIRAIANMVAVRINYDWQKALNCEFDFSSALDGLLGALKAKYQLK